ncbi:hypothetical protein ACHQM5_002150 [Ranunculus cassubicifolius]
MDDEDDFPLKHKKWLEDVSHGLQGGKIEHRSLQGLKVLIAQKGYIQCSFVAHKLVSDHDGNWHPGAMATLIDDVGAAAIGSSVGRIRLSVNFDISYFSMVKIKEEVVIDAKIVSNKGKLSSVLVEIRKKDSGEIVARGKQWMYSAFDLRASKL